MKSSLFRSGCDLNSPRREGAGGRGGEEAHDLAAPLHLCCTWGLEGVVRALLEHGANINAQVDFYILPFADEVIIAISHARKQHVILKLFLWFLPNFSNLLTNESENLWSDRVNSSFGSQSQCCQCWSRQFQKCVKKLSRICQKYVCQLDQH